MIAAVLVSLHVRLEVLPEPGRSYSLHQRLDEPATLGQSLSLASQGAGHLPAASLVAIEQRVHQNGVLHAVLGREHRRLQVLSLVGAPPFSAQGIGQLKQQRERVVGRRVQGNLAKVRRGVSVVRRVSTDVSARAALLGHLIGEDAADGYCEQPDGHDRERCLDQSLILRVLLSQESAHGVLHLGKRLVVHRVVRGRVELVIRGLDISTESDPEKEMIHLKLWATAYICTISAKKVSNFFKFKIAIYNVCSQIHGLVSSFLVLTRQERHSFVALVLLGGSHHRLPNTDTDKDKPPDGETPPTLWHPLRWAETNNSCSPRDFPPLPQFPERPVGIRPRHFDAPRTPVTPR